MKKPNVQTHLKLLTAGLVILAGFFVTPLLVSPAYAYDDGDSQSLSEEEQKKLEEKKEYYRQLEQQKLEEKKRKAAEKEAEAQRQKAQSKAAELKKTCENKRQNFVTRMSVLATQGEKRIQMLDKVTARVQEFVEEKQLVVPNYANLLADINTKKQAIADAHAVTVDKADDFDCNSQNGKASLSAFKTAAYAEINAFKDYRQSVKNLIQAVKTAAEAQEQGNQGEV